MAGGEPTFADYDEAASLRAALRLFLRHSETITRRYGLSPRQHELLLMIKASPEETSTVSELVELLQLTQSTVTELVQRAEEGGLLQRRQSASDGRVVHLSLTPGAQERLQQAVGELGPERERLLALIHHSAEPV
jgi:DNA-binding MarR family transcriptional regulator